MPAMAEPILAAPIKIKALASSSAPIICTSELRIHQFKTPPASLAPVEALCRFFGTSKVRRQLSAESD